MADYIPKVGDLVWCTYRNVPAGLWEVVEIHERWDLNGKTLSASARDRLSKADRKKAVPYDPLVTVASVYDENFFLMPLIRTETMAASHFKPVNEKTVQAYRVELEAKLHRLVEAEAKWRQARLDSRTPSQSSVPKNA